MNNAFTNLLSSSLSLSLNTLGIEQLATSPPRTQVRFQYSHVIFWAIAVGTATLAWLGALVRAALATWASVEAMVEIVE